MFGLRSWVCCRAAGVLVDPTTWGQSKSAIFSRAAPLSPSMAAAGPCSSDDVRELRSSFPSGPHGQRLIAVDPAVVVQTIISSDQRLPERYFGPLESLTVK